MDGHHGVTSSNCLSGALSDVTRYDEDGHAVNDAFVIGVAGTFFLLSHCSRDCVTTNRRVGGSASGKVAKLSYVQAYVSHPSIQPQFRPMWLAVSCKHLVQFQPS